jgi:hypothetical protein
VPGAGGVCRSSIEGQKFGAYALRDCNVLWERGVKSSRRGNPAAAVTSALVVNTGVVVRAIHASNVENAACASSVVMSCIRTRRAIADANSADHQPGRTRPQNCISASSQRVAGEQGYQDARVEIDTQRSSSSRILLTKLPASSSGNFFRRGARQASRDQRALPAWLVAGWP